ERKVYSILKSLLDSKTPYFSTSARFNQDDCSHNTINTAYKIDQDPKIFKLLLKFIKKPEYKFKPKYIDDLTVMLDYYMIVGTPQPKIKKIKPIPVPPAYTTVSNMLETNRFVCSRRSRKSSRKFSRRSSLKRSSKKRSSKYSRRSSRKRSRKSSRKYSRRS